MAKRNMNPNSLANLKKGRPFTAGPNGTAVKAQKKSAQVQAEAQRRNASLRRIIKDTMSMPTKNGKLDDPDHLESLTAVNNANLTVGETLAAQMVIKALKGDTSAMKMCMEQMNIMDENEAENEENKKYELPARLVGKAFVDLNRTFEAGHTYILKGGRGSLKSTFASEKIIEYMEQNPEVHVVAIRKVASTLRDSVYSQLCWAISEMGLDDHYKCTANPLSIRNTKTQQRIYFRGLDDAQKLKSIKPGFGYCGILWVEEADQLDGPEELRNIRQSVLRGGVGLTILSYNPPRSRSSWINQFQVEQAKTDDTVIVHTSNYLEAPPEWLGETFIADAEYLKTFRPESYAHEYMGEPIGDGGNIFEHVEIREITDEEISHMERIYLGLDWGYSPDPTAIVRLSYDRSTETITFLDEWYERGLHNVDIAEIIQKKGWTDTYITCDSSEKKSVADLRTLGVDAFAAQKGPHSVRNGVTWLQDRTLVFDPKRTPNAMKEFVEYEHDRTKDGQFIGGFPDRNNHTIDATRYALERIWNRVGSRM